MIDRAFTEHRSPGLLALQGAIPALREYGPRAGHNVKELVPARSDLPYASGDLSCGRYVALWRSFFSY
ncbi:MAG: hypothetical protein JWN43_15 [Gammaproteobacteria bacterium]|nr:hypothetical protein [Gammaproteobacteria bacterium]